MFMFIWRDQYLSSTIRHLTSWYWNVMRVLSPSCGSHNQCFVGNEEICLFQGQKEPPSSLMSVLFPPCPFTCPLNFSYVSRPLLRLSVIGKNVLSLFFSFFSKSTITMPTFPPLIFITESRMIVFSLNLAKKQVSPFTTTPLPGDSKVGVMIQRGYLLIKRFLCAGHSSHKPT